MTHKECPECNGWGYAEYDSEVHASNSNPYGYIESSIDSCENCKGTGQIEYTEDDEDDAYFQHLDYDPPSPTAIAMWLILMAVSLFTILTIFAKELLL